MKAKKAAFADPVRIEATANKAHMTTNMTTPPVFCMDAAQLIIEAIPPESFRPSAKTMAQIMRDTVEVRTRPIPWKKALVFAMHSFNFLLVSKSTRKLRIMHKNIAVASSSFTPE